MGGRLHRRCGPAGRIGRAHDASASSTHHLGARRGASTYGHRDIHPRAPGGPRCRRAVRDPGGKPRPRHVRWRPLRRGSRRGCCLRGRLCSRREGEAAELAQVRRRPSRLDGHRPGPHSRWPRRGRSAERLGVAAASLLRRRRRTSPTSSQHPGLRRWRQTARHRRPARRRCRPCRRVRRSAPPAAFAAPRGQRAGGGIRVRRTHRRTSRQSRPPGLSTGAGTTSP